MDKRARKRLACWIAASYIRGCLEAGAEVETYTDGDLAEAGKVSEALHEVIAELERRGRER